MCDQENSPIQDAVDAIVDAMAERTDGGETPSFQCFRDWCRGDIEKLAMQLVTDAPDKLEKVLFLVTPSGAEEKKGWGPWIALLQAVIRETGAGLAPASLDRVVPELVEYLAERPIPCRCVPNGIDQENLVISPREQPGRPEDVKAAYDRIRAWGAMEEFAGTDYAPVFSHLTGGLRPVVAVFDDYNNFIRSDGGFFSTIGAIPEKVKERYGQDIGRLLRSHCTNLNNLSAFFEVQAHKLWIGEDSRSLSREVADALPLEQLAVERERIGAFLVDLEWKPTLSTGDGDAQTDGDWSAMGYRAIRLLSLRFPEVPCFVYSGYWSEEKLLEALANGARWCFYKESHHAYSASSRYQVTGLELERHLTGAAETLHGAFPEPPFSDQLLVDPTQRAGRSLIEGLGLRLPLERNTKWLELRRILAKLFPEGDEMRLVKVFDSGKSKAQAAFVVRPFRNGSALASRFLKVGPWPEIQREYLAYQRTIRPRVNSHVANIVEPPAATVGIQGEMPLGVLAYSMAGLPEGYDDLVPLDDAVRRERSAAGGDSAVAVRLKETLEQVLWPLYGKEADGKIRRERPLWDWLGEVLPPVFSGVLVPPDDKEEPQIVVRSWRREGYKDGPAWLLAGRDTGKIEEAGGNSDEALSPRRLKGERIRLSGFRLLEVEWDGKADDGEITLAHPDLGWRIRLRGKANEIRRRFGALWARPGLPVNVVAIVDRENREVGKIRRRLNTALVKEGFVPEYKPWIQGACDGADPLPDPFAYFGRGRRIPFAFTFSARQSPIHGDLNLHNILFSGRTGPGWLIDFERALPHGMPALDLAKLEAEIWHHHLFPSIEQLAAAASGGKKENCMKLLHAALAAANGGSGSADTFVSLVRTQGIVARATDELLRPACRLLDAIATVRAFGQERLKLSGPEMCWALAAYFFMATKFASGDQPWRSILSCYASAFHLNDVAPAGAPDFERIFGHIREGGAGAVKQRDLDGLLIHVSTVPDGPEGDSFDLDAFTAAMGRPPEGRRIEWPENTERWDLASTGSVTNITPLFGFLWLMVKASRSRDENNGYKVMVPKISSSGASGGTVDILESGGLRFPTEPDAIVDACRRDGGVLCRQDESLTPVDKVLMARRKKTNTMKSAALVYASILAKKIAMGCTHAIVDVKVGRDGKIIAPWMADDSIEALVTGVAGDKLLLSAPSYLSWWRGLTRCSSVDEDGNNGDAGGQWLRQTLKWNGDVGAPDTPALKEVRWFFTNADMPQCRTAGRQLTLLHLDDLILKTYGDRLLEEGTNEYERLYREFLPRVCGVELCGVEPDSWHEFQEQWRRLKARLPQWGGFCAEPLFEELKLLRDGGAPSDSFDLLAARNLEKALPLPVNDSLRVITFAVGSYQPSARDGATVKQIDAWRLDGLFDWLCGEDSHDPEVGIYLHCLPGETLQGPEKAPFITILYRPDRNRDSELVHRMRRFLSEGVRI